LPAVRDNPGGSQPRGDDVLSASDDALIAGMAARDAEAARVFVRRFQHRVFGIAMAILGDRSAAEDVAQDSFVRAWRHAATFDPRRASVATWLLAITRNAAIDAARLRRATPVDPETLTALALASTERGPEQGAVDGTEIDRVRAVLAGLPADQRDALVLAVVFGRTAADVSQHQGVPLGTAKTRIRAALAKARDRLVDDEVTQ
jgi:RNA polymerase sigma factor (sigma-70 family)